MEWNVPDDPTKGHKYLYLTDADHSSLVRGTSGASFRADPLTTDAGAELSAAWPVHLLLIDECEPSLTCLL